MSKLWNFIKSRIKNTERQASLVPFIHETIDFDSFPVSDYLEWKGESTHALMKQRLRQAFFNYRSSDDPMDDAFEFYNSPMSKGFILFHRPTYKLNTWDYRFMQHHISDLLKEEKYVLNLADVRSRSKGNGVEKIFKYYLKPSVRLRQAPKAQQIYGNVSIEVILRDDFPYMFRFLANSYSDQNFFPPQPFSELIEKIVQ